MINLLPPKEKEENLAEEKLRLTLVLETIATALIFSLILILFSIKVVTDGQVQTQKILSEQKEQELKALTYYRAEKEIRDYNLLLGELDSFYKHSYELTEILQKIYQAMPLDAFLNNFSFNSAKFQISFSGFCPDRENLLTFKERLEKEEIFEEVYFPASSWTKPTAIDFSVDLKIKPK